MADLHTRGGAEPDGRGFETRQIHAGQVPDPVTGARALPIYQTTAYVFPDADSAAARFAGTEAGYTYGRLNNPTQAAVEERLASLEGGTAAVLLGSGQAAVSYAILTLARIDDHIAASGSLYGGTSTLLDVNLRRRGIHTDFVADPTDPDSWRAAITPRTKALFAESLSNPGGDVLDIEAIAEVAHEAGIPLIVDNTIGTPYLVRPIEWGADIVVHSVSKFLSGHGTVLAGAIIDAGTFDYGAHPERFADFSLPVTGYNDLVIARDFGPGGALSPNGENIAFLVKVRLEQLHDLGAAISPFSAFLVAQGIETLSLRMERHVDNAVAVATWLTRRPEVARVIYSGLPDSPHYARAQKYAPRGAGSIVSIDLVGGEAAGRAFVSALTLHSHVANIGDVRSLVIHPASTTHGQISPEQQRAAGVTPGLVRLSVGLETLTDIIADLERGFAAVAALHTPTPSAVDTTTATHAAPTTPEGKQ